MDVFLVPVGDNRYELYCEEPDEAEAPEAEAPAGAVQRLVHRFRHMVAEAERERRDGGPEPGAPPRGFLARVQARIMRWVAESIAEQRLLWQLRRRTAACLVHPSDLSEAHAREILRRQLNRDFERHRFWLAIDSIGLIGSAALMLVPGPNIVAYYFAFRIVGHYLSVRGARQGIVKCAWGVQPSEPLTALRQLIHLARDQREEGVREIAALLRLDRFTSFFQKSAVE
jgi:hypothetical protein